jgi:hypothetical protein
MKTNCNIVKNMYDRVIRRKLGLLCTDDLSNEIYLESYRNRLDCEIVDTSCYGDNKPCETTTYIPCGFTVNITYEEIDGNYVFTATPTGNVGAVTYTWDFNPFAWNVVSIIGNVMTLEPAFPIGGSFISVTALDTRECPAVDYIRNVEYFTALALTTDYKCKIGDIGDFCITVVGGYPPYTLVGSPGGGEVITSSGGSYCESLLNGTSWSVYAIDSQSNVTPINSGTIVCPFDCGSVTINPDVTIDCLVDGLGNSTGQAQVFANPAGGTAPYIITISVNSASPVTFVNGSIYNHDDDIEIFVVDANGCEESFFQKISCPPTVPGGLFDDCEALAGYLKDNGGVFAIQVTILNAALAIGGGYFVDYKVEWTSSIPAPLTIANFPVVTATIENNTTTNLGSQTVLPSFAPIGNPYVYNGGIVTNNQVTIQAGYTTSLICGPTLRAFVPGGPNLNLKVDLDFTVVVGSLVCHLCDSALFSLDYDPCDFIPADDTEFLLLTVCPL